MADSSKSNPSSSSSVRDKKEVKSPNVFERAREEVEAIFHVEKHHKETHGLRSDIDENTPISDVKGPNVFERAKEEIEAIYWTIHPKKEHTSYASGSPVNGGETSGATLAGEAKHETMVSYPEKEDVKDPNQNDSGKEQTEGMHKIKSPPRHHKETHGMSGDIDVDIPISEFKGPNVFERAKEEFEALVQTIQHPKQESDDDVLSPKKEAGFRDCLGPLGRGLEKVCSPRGHKRD